MILDQALGAVVERLSTALRTFSVEKLLNGFSQLHSSLRFDAAPGELQLDA
jgi:hypothetical protein